MTGAFFYLHQTERLKGRFDVVGALLSVAGMVSLVYGFIHVAHSGWGNTETFTVFTVAVLLLVGFVLFEAYGTSEPMMPMRIFEERNRSRHVPRDAGRRRRDVRHVLLHHFLHPGRPRLQRPQDGFAFLPVAFVIGGVSQVVSKLLPRFGPKPLIVVGTTLLTIALLWLSTVDASASYFGVLLPGMIVLAVAMGFLFVPLTTVAVSKVAQTDAGLASALLNVGQQVGGSIGLSVLATVFATSAKNYAHDHTAKLGQAISKLPGSVQGPVGDFVHKAGSNNVQPGDIKKFVDGLPANERGPAAGFFSGPYSTFGHDLQAHASGQGFFAAAMFAVVALVSRCS